MKIAMTDLDQSREEMRTGEGAVGEALLCRSVAERMSALVTLY
jgi:hypothetical protein